MNLPDTLAPEEIGTRTDRAPRRPIATPGGLSFYCPCCDEGAGVPMRVLTRGPVKAQLKCDFCGSHMVCRVVPGRRVPDVRR